MTINIIDKRQALYNSLSNDFELGDFDTFSKKLNDGEKRRALYDAASQQYDLGTFDEFEQKVYIDQSPEAIAKRVANTPNPFENVPMLSQIKELGKSLLGFRSLNVFQGELPAELAEAYQTPTINITSKLNAPEEDQIAYGAAYGLAKLGEGLTTPENLFLLGTMAKAPESLQQVGTAVFKTLMGIGAYEAGKGAYENAKEGQYGLASADAVVSLGSALLADCILSIREDREPYYWVALRTVFRFIFCRGK